MKRYKSPITEGNFDSASKFLLKFSGKCLSIRRAYQVVVPVGTILFIALSLLFSYGAIFSLGMEDDMIIFANLQPVTDVWEYFRDMLMQEGAAWYINLAIFAGVLFGLPMAVCLVLSILLRLTKRTPKLPAEAVSFKDKAKELHKIVSSYKNPEKEEGVWPLVSAGVYILFLLAFAVYSYILTMDVYTAEGVVALIFGAGVCLTIVYFAFAFLFSMFHYLSILACYPESIEQEQQELYDFWCSVDPEEAANREKKKKEEQAKKAAAERSRLDLYKDTAYYRERKAEALSQLNPGAYSTYEIGGTHYDAKERLQQFLTSGASQEAKQDAIKRFNEHYLDNFTE